jgi:hypothetical protein
MNEIQKIIEELNTLDGELIPLMAQRDAAARLTELLPRKFSPSDVTTANGLRVWELSGLYFLFSGRVHEALGVFWGLYERMLDAQSSTNRVHKGVPLVWISECYHQLGFPVHAKRYLMLTLCEDAIYGKGSVSTDTGVYFRLVWRQGLSDRELQRYAREIYQAAQTPEGALFPENLLQQIDDNWLIELPSRPEAFAYRVNSRYVRHLLAQLGRGSGKELEHLASYLMSCMPGCRTKTRMRSRSTDYDVVCAMEGIDVDFRSELGRHFVCECKDWNNPADYTTMAKFCRVLDSTKSRFGILFSRAGISGVGKAQNAEGEQLKVFQDRGIVIIALDQSDLERVADGANLVAILRERYEKVRLDIRS